MIDFPIHFREEIEKEHVRQTATTRHLALLENEGLYLWERWYTLRGFNDCQPKDL